MDDPPRSKDAEAFYALLPSLFDPKREVVIATAQTLHRMMKKLTSQQLIALDEAVRNSKNAAQPAWDLLSPKAVQKLSQFGEASVSLLGLAGFHRSGFVREEAIKELGKIKDGSELSFLIIRMNDWVTSVRVPACRFVSERLKPEYASLFFAHLRLVINGDKKLYSCVGVSDSIYKLLASNIGLSDWLKGMNSKDAEVRETCFQLALREFHEELLSILQEALKVSDPIIKQQAAALVWKKLDKEQVKSLLPLLRKDKFAPLRKAALNMYLEAFSEEAEEALYSFALDPNQSIRETARFHLKKQQPIDFLEFYKAARETESPWIALGVIGGIGDLGSAKEAPFIEPFAFRFNTKVRAKAISTLSKLNGDKYVELFFDLLQNEKPKICHAAREALRRRIYSGDAERLWTIFQSSPYLHTRLDALALLENFNQWKSFPYLAAALSDPSPQVQKRTKQYIGSWIERMHKNLFIPASEDIAKTKQAFESAKNFLPDWMVEKITRILE